MSADRPSQPSPAARPPRRFRSGQRLRLQRDFRRVREQGRRMDGGIFTLWWRAGDGAGAAASAPARVGVVASIAAVGSAVRRNAAKRRLRELFRRHQAIFPPGSDLLLVARAALNRMTFREAETRFLQVCERLPLARHD